MPPTVRLTANAFGMRHVGMMYGWIMVMHQLGSATAAYGSGLLRTEVGDYYAAFVTAGALCMIAAFLVLAVGKTRKGSSAARPVLVGVGT